MECPICEIGIVISEYMDTPEEGAELSCSNIECKSHGYGIYCWLCDFVDWATAEAFYEEWSIEYYANEKQSVGQI